MKLAKKDKQENKKPSLAEMVGMNDTENIAGKSYKIEPLKLKHIPEWEEDGINVGPQYFSMVDENQKKLLDKWIRRQVKTEEGEEMTIEKAVEEGWDVKDLREVLLTIISVSG